MSRTLWLVVLIASLLYLVTSLVVVINTFVWMPSFPSIWYGMESIIYFPFRIYMDVMYGLLGKTSISYQEYALIVRGPILVASVAAFIISLRRLLATNAQKKASEIADMSTESNQIRTQNPIT